MSAPDPRPLSDRASAQMSAQVSAQGRCAWAVLAIGVLGVAVLAAWLTPWQWLPGGAKLPTPSPADHFSARQLEFSHDYAGAQRRLALTSYAVSVLVSCVLGFTRIGSALIGRLRGWWWVKVVVGSLLLLLAGELATLPWALSSRANALDAGITRQPLDGWIRDQALSLLVATVFTSVGALIVIGLARWLPRTWPVWAGMLCAAAVGFGSYVYPLLVEPLFNSFSSLPSGQTRTAIQQLADDEGVRLDDVLVSDASRRTTTLNAYVTGIGNTRRVVIYDNALSRLTQSELESVVAHELAHAKHRDVLVGTLLGGCAGAAGIGLLALIVSSPAVRRRSAITGPADPRALALLLAVSALGTLAASPAQNAISRAMEARADLTALEATQNPRAFVAMQRKLALGSRSEPDPPALTQFWFGSHPTTMQRIAMAQWFARRG